ncbi:methyltransferase domain-containing protein [archaeon]|jgi:tRNA G10  N-methylase Trm11|nr:methyltransferase domain-containing protein [archaeon]MBT4397489.1 methyltransferase domain-containing protein [archaeon]MBT4440884.1 methyltransferase domain-containing protein [archaeon]
MRCILILGRDPQLGLAEFESYSTSRGISYKIIKKSDVGVVLDLPDSLNCKKVMKEIGGSQKIVRVIEDFDGLYRGGKGKLKYAISNYTSDDVSDLKEELKQYFKSQGLKAMLKKSHHKQTYLNPSEAQNVLEIVVFDEYIGKTIAIFNPNDHKTRDLKRPDQERLHSISIRLAKILINLSGAKKKDKLLDPFCGIGTILQEAMLLGVEVYGIDKSATMLKSAKNNIAWLRKSYSVKPSFKLFLGDATRMSSYVKKVDYVVSEPFMGPFLRKLPTPQDAKKTIKKLEPMYNAVLKEIKSIRCKKAVIVVPVFFTRTRRNFELDLDLTGFKVTSFEYETPTSKLKRRILILEKR